MFRKILAAALISTATAIAGPALAGPGGGHAGGMGGPSMHAGGMFGPSSMGMSSRMDSHAFMHAEPRANMHMSGRSAMRFGSASRRHASVHLAHGTSVRHGTHAFAGVHSHGLMHASFTGAHSQGLMHASFTAIEHASPRSALARSAVRPSVLPGLNTGLTVKGSDGATIGTVSRVVTGNDGMIRLVVASSSTGRMIRLAPNTLSISGGVVTTTML
jgi:hypothetical protein